MIRRLLCVIDVPDNPPQSIVEPHSVYAESQIPEPATSGGPPAWHISIAANSGQPFSARSHAAHTIVLVSNSNHFSTALTPHFGDACMEFYLRES